MKRALLALCVLIGCSLLTHAQPNVQLEYHEKFYGHYIPDDTISILYTQLDYILGDLGYKENELGKIGIIDSSLTLVDYPFFRDTLAYRGYFKLNSPDSSISTQALLNINRRLSVLFSEKMERGIWPSTPEELDDNLVKVNASRNGNLHYHTFLPQDTFLNGFSCAIDYQGREYTSLIFSKRQLYFRVLSDSIFAFGISVVKNEHWYNHGDLSALYFFNLNTGHQISLINELENEYAARLLIQAIQNKIQHNSPKYRGMNHFYCKDDYWFEYTLEEYQNIPYEKMKPCVTDCDYLVENTTRNFIPAYPELLLLAEKNNLRMYHGQAALLLYFDLSPGHKAFNRNSINNLCDDFKTHIKEGSFLQEVVDDFEKGKLKLYSSKKYNRY